MSTFKNTTIIVVDLLDTKIKFLEIRIYVSFFFSLK